MTHELTTSSPSPEEVAAILGVPLMPWQRALVAQALGDEAPMRGYYLTVPKDSGRANLDRLREEHVAQLELERNKRAEVERNAAVSDRCWLGLVVALTAVTAILTSIIAIGAP